MLERAREVTRNGKYTYIEYARFADDLVNLDRRLQAQCCAIRRIERNVFAHFAILLLFVISGGHAAVVPPRSVMNSRRRMCPPIPKPKHFAMGRRGRICSQPASDADQPRCPRMGWTGRAPAPNRATSGHLRLLTQSAVGDWRTK